MFVNSIIGSGELDSNSNFTPTDSGNKLAFVSGVLELVEIESSPLNSMASAAVHHVVQIDADL